MNVFETIPWVIQHHGPKTVACFIEDKQGALCKAAVEAGAKRTKFFVYTGLNIPAETIKELSKKYPAVVVNNVTEPSYVNCEFAAVMHPQLGFVWHCPMGLSFGDEQIPNAVVMAKIKGDPTAWFWPGHMVPQQSFQVKTRNCVADDQIQANVTYNLQLGLPTVQWTYAHGRKAILVSGGKSVKDEVGGGPWFDEIARKQKEGGYVVCVKTSHDWLIERGIVPWGCILLDPRDHVRDFIDNPHPAVNYFASSTVHSSTLDRLVSRRAKVWLYHALVGAGEREMVRLHNEVATKALREVNQIRKDHGLPPKEVNPYWKQDMLISGGTASATRGIAVLHSIGFRDFEGYGYDCCYYDKVDLKAKKDDGSPRYHELKLGGRKFVTDAELVAQIQDFDHLLSALPDCRFTFHGAGMIATKVQMTRRQVRDFAEVFEAEYPRTLEIAA